MTELSLNSLKNNKADLVHSHVKNDISDFAHTHTKSQITDFPANLPANGGNSDTVDGLHASAFALTSHGNHVPTTQTANNTVFLRNDNTWQTVTPANIGAATTSHNHTLDALSNVTITSNAVGEILKWNGTAWVNNTLAEAGIQVAGSYAPIENPTFTGTVTAPTFKGALTGNATTATTATTANNIPTSDVGGNIWIS